MCNFPKELSNTVVFYELKKIFTIALQNILFCNELVSYIKNYLNIIIGENSFDIEIDNKSIIIIVSDDSFNNNKNKYAIIHKMIYEFCINSFYNDNIINDIVLNNSKIDKIDNVENIICNIFDIFIFSIDNNKNYYRISFSNQ